MSKPSEDKLIKYAFDDLAEEDLLALEVQLMKEESLLKEVKAFQLMRNDLKEIKNDIPPCQLSIERVRDAILREDILEKKRSRNYGLFFLPALAMATGLFFLFVAPNFLMQDVHHGVSIAKIMEQEHNAISPFNGLSIPARKTANSSNLTSVAQEVGAEGRGHSQRNSSIVRRIVPIRRSSSSARAKYGRTRSRPPVSRSYLAQNARTPSLGASTWTAAPLDPSTIRSEVSAISTSRPIVMIMEERDTNTGAQQANEIKADNQVIISG